MASSGSSEKIDEFLIEEYKKQTEGLAASEEVGDTRVSQFMTITSTLISAFGIANILSPTLNKDNPSAITSSMPSEIYVIALIGLFALLAFGRVTLVRIVHRNFVTDRHKINLGRIRKYFLAKDPKILAYLPYNPYEEPEDRRDNWKAKWKIPMLGTGGLVQTVALMNNIIVATIFIVFCLHYTAFYDVLSFSKKKEESVYILPFFVIY